VKHIDLSRTYALRCETAGAGFLNFYFGDAFYADIVADVLAKGEAYGRSNIGAGKRVLVEFVSANPTGPMHMGNARGGALGDCLATVLEAAGYVVEREFYVNDGGNQIEKFGLSLDVRYRQHFGNAIEMPEDAYHGDDITQRAEQFAQVHGDSYLAKPEQERRAALVAFAALVTLTTRTTDLVDVVVTAVTPLRRAGVHPERIGLLLLLGLRCVPLLAGLVDRVREAQIARSGAFSLSAFAVPLIISALRQADAMGEALLARGVDD